VIIRRCLLFTYRVLLHLYPQAFRERFAPEMTQLAAEADPAEWPLILGDTTFAIIRSWIDPSSPSATTVPANKDTYVAVGGSALSAPRLFVGLVLSLAIVLGLTYAGSLGNVELPKCHAAAVENISW